jgi:hypothetical protein
MLQFDPCGVPPFGAFFLLFGGRDISQQPLNGNANAPSLVPICGVKSLVAAIRMILQELCA